MVLLQSLSGSLIREKCSLSWELLVVLNNLKIRSFSDVSGLLLYPCPMWQNALQKLAGILFPG